MVIWYDHITISHYHGDILTNLLVTVLQFDVMILAYVCRLIPCFKVIYYFLVVTLVFQWHGLQYL